MEGVTQHKSVAENQTTTNSYFHKNDDVTALDKTSTEDDYGHGSNDDICKFYLAGACRFGDDCFNVHIGDVPQTAAPGARKKCDRQPGHSDDWGSGASGSGGGDASNRGKKSRMKTAEDVINRIKWDQDFDEVNS